MKYLPILIGLASGAYLIYAGAGLWEIVFKVSIITALTGVFFMVERMDDEPKNR